MDMHVLPRTPQFQIQFPLLRSNGSTLSFPCDGSGNVDLDRLSDVERRDYFFARLMTRRPNGQPRVVRVSGMN